VAGGLVATAMLAWLFVPADFYTGTNSVRGRGAVTTLRAGQELCVRGLLIPSGTARAQLQLATTGPRPTLVARATAGTRTVKTKLPGATSGGGRKVEFAVPGPPAGADSAPGTVCVSPRAGRPVSLFGIFGLQGDVAPTLGTKPVQARVAVWFLPPKGEKRRPIAMLPTVFERAALFRPGFVGPWTYWVLMLVAVPALTLVGVRLLATAEIPRPRLRSLGAVIFALAALNAACWTLITPSFNAPDESEHFAYAQYVAETGNSIDSSQGPRATYSTEESLALDGTRLFSSTEGRDGKPPWLRADELRWEHRVRSARPPADNGGGYSVSGSAHSPAYYALLAPAYYATVSQSTFTQLWAMRLVSALMGGVVALCAFAIVRELVPQHLVAAVGAGLLVAFQPMFSFMSGAVNNDMGVNLGAAVLLYLLIRALRRGPTPLLGVGIGAALVVTPLLKGTGLALYPAALVALALIALRHHSRRHLLGLAAVAGSLVAFTLAWDLITPLFEPTAQGRAAGSAAVSSARSDIPGALSYLWQVFLPRLPFMGDLFVERWPAFDIYAIRGWGAFGWYALTFPKWVYVLIALTMLATAALAGVAVVRRRAVARGWGPEMLVLLTAIVGLIAAVHFAYYSKSPRPIIAEFGRYAFPAITALATVAVGSAFALPRGWLAPAVTVLVVLVMGLSYASRLLTLVGFYS
jgi:4-amino-4-deoxy-L-arabinose transferase-like glycosyltransferase